MKKIRTILLIVFLFTIIIAVFCKMKMQPSRTIKVGEKKVFVEIADTAKERAKGLSGKERLEENSGMLFVFENPGYHAFWMKDMLFALDFIWTNEKEVIEITKNVQPEKYQPPKTLVPKNKVDAVLEVEAGFVEKNNIKLGDKISY